MRPTNRKGFYTALSVVITLVFGMLAFNAISGNNGTSAAVSSMDPNCVEQVNQFNVKHPGSPQDANVLCATATTPTTTVTPDPTVTPATTTMAPATTVTTATTTMVTTATANTVAMKPTPSFSSTETHGSWTYKATERLAENPIVMAWMDRLQDPTPEMWKTFPNVPNTDVPEFRVVDGTQVPDGMEYGTYDSPYCYTDPCDFIVGAWEYRYYSGPYNFEGFECGMVGSDQGCLLLVINVMDQSYTFRDNSFDNGFTLRGRYFNGDALEWGVWGLVSNGSANMLNMPTMAHPDEVLNSGDPGNSGANCGTPQGCNSVNVRVLVYAGDALISVLETTVTK
ncbi:hypothetical protein KA525_02370 [Candidatus Woesebacteria bacterium]|nr:hypothetical protein [Candidatus Woesebacteria bacterium]